MNRRRLYHRAAAREPRHGGADLSRRASRRWSPPASRIMLAVTVEPMAAAYGGAAGRRVLRRRRVLPRRIRAAPDRRAGSARRRASRRVGGAAGLGGVARRPVRPGRRAARADRAGARPPRREPVRLCLGLQIRPLFAGAGEPRPGHQQRPAGAALGAARLCDRAADAPPASPICSSATPIPTPRGVRLDPGGAVVGAS